MLTTFYSAEGYPEKVRRIRYYDVETDKHLCFLTNNFLLPALTIAQLYKCRWQLELLFKWIKQHLWIKVFYGTSETAVEDSGLDRHLDLCAGGHSQKTIGARPQPLHNPTDFERHTI